MACLKPLVKCGALLALGWYAAGVQAGAPMLESSTPFLPESTLTELVADIASAGKNIGRNPDLPGWRLRLSCNHQPLPPGWVAGAAKPQFAWSCLAAWERKTLLPTATIWAAEREEMFSGATDGDPAAVKEALRQRLYQFFQLKSPASPPPKPTPSP